MCVGGWVGWGAVDDDGVSVQVTEGGTGMKNGLEDIQAPISSIL